MESSWCGAKTCSWLSLLYKNVVSGLCCDSESKSFETFPKSASCVVLGVVKWFEEFNTWKVNFFEQSRCTATDVFICRTWNYLKKDRLLISGMMYVLRFDSRCFHWNWILFRVCLELLKLHGTRFAIWFQVFCCSSRFKREHLQWQGQVRIGFVFWKLYVQDSFL